MTDLITYEFMEHTVYVGTQLDTLKKLYSLVLTYHIIGVKLWRAVISKVLHSSLYIEV